MTNLETIPYYEKLHDLFERVAPKEMPAKLEKLIRYLREGADHYEQTTGDSIDVDGEINTLEEMKQAFTTCLSRSGKSLLLCHQDRKYEVNIYPIMLFLKNNTSIAGDLANLKAQLVYLSNSTNNGVFKQSYKFVDDLSLTLED